jgi:sirohydrochlorin ferrochelatase
LSDPSGPAAGLLIVAHGDRRRTAAGSRALLAHAARIAARWPCMPVRVAVLHGEPSLQQAFSTTSELEGTLLVYPFFITDGHGVGEMLTKHPSEFGRRNMCLMPPFGFDPALPSLLLNASLSAAEAAGFVPGRTGLLLVAHGRRLSRKPAAAIVGIAADLRSRDIFASVEPAFLEQQPFLRDALKSCAHPTVVAGCFAGEGFHACVDVPAAVEEVGKDVVYTGPIGAHPEVAGLIIDAVADALACLPHAVTDPIYPWRRPCGRTLQQWSP